MGVSRRALQGEGLRSRVGVLLFPVPDDGAEGGVFRAGHGLALFDEFVVARHVGGVPHASEGAGLSRSGGSALWSGVHALFGEVEGFLLRDVRAVLST